MQEYVHSEAERSLMTRALTIYFLDSVCADMFDDPCWAVKGICRGALHNIILQYQAEWHPNFGEEKARLKQPPADNISKIQSRA
jgi:hypothetical protein